MEMLYERAGCRCACLYQANSQNLEHSLDFWDVSKPVLTFSSPSKDVANGRLPWRLFYDSSSRESTVTSYNQERRRLTLCTIIIFDHALRCQCWKSCTRRKRNGYRKYFMHYWLHKLVPTWRIIQSDCVSTPNPQYPGSKNVADNSTSMHWLQLCVP